LPWSGTLENANTELERCCGAGRRAAGDDDPERRARLQPWQADGCRSELVDPGGLWADRDLNGLEPIPAPVRAFLPGRTVPNGAERRSLLRAEDGHTDHAGDGRENATDDEPTSSKGRGR
jgi:hypothetical protein